MNLLAKTTMGKNIGLFTILLCLQFTYTYGQETDCNKTKVGVYFIEIGDQVINHLNTKYGTQSREDWINYIDDQVVEALQKNSPEIDFFSSMKDNTSDPDYIFRYTLHLTAVDGEMLFAGDSIILTKEIDFWDGVEYTDAEYDQVTAFHMTGGLVVNTPCVPNLRWIIEINLVSDLELEGVITKLSQSFWRLSNIIEAHENRRLAPAREPKIEITYDKPFLSLLDEESRKMKVTVKVKNCKGQIAYYPVHSQPVYYEDRLDRFNLKNHLCASQGHYKGHLIMLVYKNLETNGIYKVIKGVNPVEQKISIGTCGISSKSEIYTEGKIIVKGLKIEVVPDKYQVYPDDATNIVIRFIEVNPNGNKESVPGRMVDINIKGLVDGSISPKGNYNTNEKGEIHLRYKAGKKDKKITITASYQPINYPDIVTGSSYINVISKDYAWNGSLNIEVTNRFQCNAIKKIGELSQLEVRANDEFIQKANVNIGMNDFDLALQPAIAVRGTDFGEVSGQMHCTFNDDHFTTIRSEKTECYNEEAGEGQRSWIWVSPGNWNTKHETSTGQASRSIYKENISFLISKDMELNKDEMKNLQQQMQEAAQNKDYAAIQKLKGQMVGMVQGDQDNNTIPIRIHIEIVFDITKKDLVTKTFERKAYKVCKDSTENESGTNNIELSIAMPIVVEMKGTYTKSKDGSDIIKASIDMTGTSQDTFHNDICQDEVSTITGQINLERKRK